MSASTKRSGSLLASLGALLQLGPLVGLVMTVYSMVQAFSIISVEGEGSAEQLSEEISSALIATSAGMIPGLIGWILMLMALFGYGYRELWFFWFLIFYSFFLMLMVPIGALLGAFLFIYLVVKNKEFFAVEAAGE